MYNILFNKPTKEFFTSIGILTSGIILLLLSQSLFLGKIELVYIYYSFFTYLSLRFIEILSNYFSKNKNNKLISFSYSWLLLLLIICLFGLTNYKFPIKLISLVALIDILLLTLNNYKLKNLKIINFFIGLFFGLILIFFSTLHTNTTIWLVDFAHIGIADADYLRDAAIANSWDKYSSLSHGIHGLLFEPYHALFAIFSKPFLIENFNIFKVFSFYAYIFVPTLFFYGVSKLSFCIGNKFISDNSIIVAFLFFLTFSQFDYVISQRSFLVASLIYIAAIPIFFNLLIKEKNNYLEIFIFGFVVLIILFARAHHGLFLAGFLFYFFLVKKGIQKKLIYLLFFIFSVLFSLNYYGNTSTSSEKPILGFLKYFFSPPDDFYISSFIVPLFIYLLYLFFKKKLVKIDFFKFNFNKFNTDILFFFTFLFSFSILLILIPFNRSDVFYVLVPIYWLMFFIIISDKFLNLFLGRKKFNLIINSKAFKSIFVLIIIFIFSNFVKINGHTAKNTLVNTIKNIRILNNHWNFEGGNKLFVNNLNSYKCISKSDLFCEIRQKIFTLNDPKVFVKKFTPYDILKKAKETENKLDGITAVYIHPDNKYWSFFGEIYHFKPSLYLMSAGKIPLIFGAHYKDTGVSIGNETIYGYSIATAHKNQGTLRDLEDIGDNKKICKIANSVRIDNIIIFDYLNNVKDIIICNN